MIVRARSSRNAASSSVAPRPTFRRRTICHLIAVALTAGSMAAHAAPPQAFSPAWFAQKQAQPGTAPTAGTPGGAGTGLPAAGSSAANLLLQQRVQQSINNLNQSAQAVAAQIAAQKAAAEAAVKTPGDVPNGLAAGGLNPAAGIAGNPSLWQNAKTPVQSVAAGSTVVEVKQTARKAILTWDTFNVGRDTTLYFNQSAGNQNDGSNDWIALNRVVDPSGSPSKILGQIRAEGTVYLLNHNGMIFGAGSRVNTHALVASSLDLFSSDLATSNATFLNEGLAASPNGAPRVGMLTGSFTDGRSHDVVIEKGASITSGAQGFALVAAQNVTNAGSIVADDGQVILAATSQLSNVGQNGALSAYDSSTFGTDYGSNRGTVTNTGLVQSRRGKVSMLGYGVTQAGVALASTSIAHPGSIELLAQNGVTPSDGRSSRSGPLLLAAGSVTAVLPEKDGTTTSSSAAADKAFVNGHITLTGGSITLQNGSLVEAPGATVNLTALRDTGFASLLPENAGRIYMDAGAIIDVSGLANVVLPISALLVTIPRIGQNELANSPLLRNSFLYTQKDVVVDTSQSGTRDDGLDWIGSPILNVQGYVDNVPRDISQLLTRGGSIGLDANEVILRSGSQLKLDGGFVAYQAGWITTPNLLGADGRIYNIAYADPSVNYVGFAGQYNATHARWGKTETYNSPLLGGMRRWDDGFVSGSDAGTLSIHADRALVLDGDISAVASAGTRQVANGSQPASGRLTIDTMPTSSNRDVYMRGVLLQQSTQLLDSLVPGFNAGTAWEDAQKAQDGTATQSNDLRSWLIVSADMISRAGFDNVSISTKSNIVEAAGTQLNVNPGGSVALTAGRIDIYGDIHAPAGQISLTTGVPVSAPGPGSVDTPLQHADIHIGSGASLSTRGLWINDSGMAPADIRGDRYANGGTISLQTQQAYFGDTVNRIDGTGSIMLDAGSTLDVSGGGYVGTDGRVAMSHGVPQGRGGDVSLVTYASPGPLSFELLPSPTALDSARIVMGGDILSHGFGGGGNLTLQAAEVRIGGNPDDMALSNGLYLAPSFFAGQGFDGYMLHAITDAIIAADTTVHVERANFLPDLDALRTLATGSDLYATTSGGVGFLDAYRRWATRDPRTGHGPGFSLTAGEFLRWPFNQRDPINGGSMAYPGVTGSVVINKGAVVETDAAGTISLASTHATIVDGTLRANGGNITLTTSSTVNLLPSVAPKVWLGSNALLDASGVSLIDTQAGAATRSVSGIPVGVTPRTGTVLDGGSVSLLAADGGYVVTQAGAVIDVSGVADTFDLPSAAARLQGANTAYAPTAVWSDAGSIMFGAAAGLFADATLRATGGAAQAEGGTLSILAMDSGGNDRRPQPTGIVIQQSGDLVPTGATEQGAVESGKPSGVLHFAADRLNGSGISSLVIGPAVGPAADAQIPVSIGFAGDVDLSLGRSISLYGTGYVAMPDGATSVANGTGFAQGNGHVRLAAPYVNISGVLPGSGQPTSSPLAGDGSLVVDAGFIDMGGRINLQRWANATFNATGDIRFTTPAALAYGSDGKPVPGMLFSTGDLTFKAAQLYPSTDYRFVINANASGIADAQGATRTTTVTILPGGASTTPLSAGGSLLIDADDIEQGGTVRAPAGSLVMGVSDPAAQAADFGLTPAYFPLVATSTVHLAPGSLTSVSLDGLLVPYGTTVDGVEWRYNGSPRASSTDLTAPPSKAVQVNGTQVSLDKGAGIDLSGGGSLVAGEWVPGVGGSRDLLASQYADGRAIYAIIPGYASPVAAHDMAFEAASGAGSAVGKSVYLSGIPGLPPGMYTLLPARYAELPGAFRVVQDTSSIDSVLGRSALHPDGSYSVTGYFADGLSGARDARNTTFLVQSASTWQQYSQYRLTDADAFFAAQASKAGVQAPSLLADAGRLVLAASQSLDLGATLTANPAKGGRSSQVDIAGQAIEIVGSGESARDGYLTLSADGLTQLGAGSLLIGGVRHHVDAGDLVDSVADSVILSNDAAHPLAGQEILLVSRASTAPDARGVLLQSGSVILATGATNPVASQPLIFGADPGKDAAGNATPAVSGDGSMLRVSQNSAATVIRHQVPGTGDVAGTSTGRLSIEANALVQGGNALTLDAAGAMHVDADAVFSAKAIDANSNRISFVGEGVDATDRDGLVIGPGVLNLFRNADEVTLRSRGEIDFLGNLDIELPNALALSASSLVGDGGDVLIRAARVALGNTMGAVVAPAGATGGSLGIMADEVDLGPGMTSVNGFSAFTATAARGFRGQGTGGVDFGGMGTTLTAPVFIADSGANTTLQTTGALRLNGSTGTALTSDALGGALTLSGGSTTVGMNMDATAGTLDLSATEGDLVIAPGTRLDVAGINRTFFDTTTYASGGTLRLHATKGSVNIGSNASMLFGGGAQGGDAGSFTATAAQSVLLGGTLDGHAAKGYRGGYFTLDAGAAQDLDALARLAAAAGATGMVDISSGTGDLTLSAGNTLAAQKVYLSANGGTTRINGTVNAAAAAGSRIELYGRQGVDVEGSLIATSSIAAQRGGDVVLGTTGTGDGTLNDTYGYQNVQRGDAGSIHVGANARIDVSGGAGSSTGGRVSMRAPLLADGDVPITLDGGAGNIVGARDVTIEPYAVWSTTDASTSPARHFDGMIDPAGWYHDVDGKPTLVAGKWTDASGKVLAAPVDEAQLKQYLSTNFFTPDDANADHLGFYGYAGGDAASGPGTLMGFIQNPGFTFGNRFAAITNVNVRPGIELRNPTTGYNNGTISVLTNWNLGAGVTDDNGKIHLAYRYGNLAPILTVRAAGNLDLSASITDGFYQQNNGAVLSDAPAPTTPPAPDNGYAAALAAYQTSDQYFLDNDLWNGTINLADGDPDDGKTPGGGVADISKDRYYQPLQAPLKDQTADYYTNYQRYIGEIGDGDNENWAATFNRFNNVVGRFLTYNPTTLPAPQPGDYGNYADYATDYENWLETNFNSDARTSTPSPILLPVDSAYGAYTVNYATYIDGHNTYYNYVATQVGNRFFGTQLFYAPFAPRSDAQVHNPAYDSALAAYQTSLAYFDANALWNGTITLASGDPDDGKTPGGGIANITRDPYYQPLQAPLTGQSNNYYANYQLYIGEIGDGDNENWAAAFNRFNNVVGHFLTYSPTALVAPQPGAYTHYADYAADYENWLETNFNSDSRTTTPSPILTPVDTAYADYTANYGTYIDGHNTYYNYVATQVGNRFFGTQLFYAPFAPRPDAGTDPGGGSPVVPPAAANNSPSNMPSLGNATSLASATLLGGSSTSYRFVAGANVDAANVLATSTSGDILLDGHFSVKDTLTDPSVVTPRSPYAGKTLVFPTTIRTGTGSIDMASGGDIQWLDDASPATVYTAGAPAQGTTSGTDVSVLRPSEKAPGAGDTLPDMLVTGLVNPDNAGDISLDARGNINAVQYVVDADGSVTRGGAGTSISQYWWQWMQTGNAADGSRSSINYGNFAQGVMSVGGNVSVNAGGNISELSVSLPTTWYASTARDSITTVGGGNLDVHAGGNILSGAYFVAKGIGRVDADGAISAAADLSALNLTTLGNPPVNSPLSTLFALQDAQLSVNARQGANIGGVYDPSYYIASNVFGALLPAGHADMQGYSEDSSLSVVTAAGDLVMGSLRAPGLAFGAGGVAGPVLPASLSLTALGGDVDILADGQLYPSASGNLSILADGGVSFSRQTVQDSQGRSFGLIDADPASMPSPLSPATSNIDRIGVDPLGGAGNARFHQPVALHGADDQPVRIYALGGDIVDGTLAPNGFSYLSLVLAPAKQALIYADRDIVNLSLVGQHTHDADITRVAAGRDIYDTAYLPNGSFGAFILGGYQLLPSIALGGPGALLVEAGRNIGPFSSELDASRDTNPSVQRGLTGIQSVGNLFNPYLPHDGADVSVLFGVGPGVDTAAFFARYLDPADGAPGTGSLLPDLVDFMNQRVAGTAVNTGYAGDKVTVSLTPEQARALFDEQPDYVQRLFAEKALFKILAAVGNDYNTPSSPYFNQYARGYDAISTLFPASLGYTANGSGAGGENGAATTVSTGDLDIRSSTIQTQQGGDVTVLGPGGQALLGSTSAPSQIVDSRGNVLAGPNTMGVLTLESGAINMFTDQSVLLAQSRVFTERGGDLVMWSSNGDINAGQGAKTTAEIPPPTYLCDIDAWCRIDARGQVSGAGIATLQTVEGAPAGSVYLIAPRGTVDAGDAGIRVAGNLIIAAARVANADNIQVKGDSAGVPVTASVNIGALNAASAAASAASKVAEDVVRKQQADSRDRMPSVISVQVLRDGNNSTSVDRPAQSYDMDSPVQVLGAGQLDSMHAKMLTDKERSRLKNN
ncbi:filamentous hemagglutinin family protein [Luteibacter sp. Sphag1AF]|uniref:filamentous haemagglutinin family protein n=1 Tax=Luteibacter sp. Sphag1AF TaxID=2587031 RepID=UPI0016167E17|nr:filamentous haemagglutinin family protein [Luteibacter sp. Sphag1AF]MBB3227623.1 filamentous hemagglutinin family protein [Luteibacter sp. Sphag1AF]